MAEKNSSHPYVLLARETVRRRLAGETPVRGGIEIADGPDIWGVRRACFVSIKTKRGDLRGCIGTIEPVQPTIDLEIISNAISSSTRDPRFPPMTSGELLGVVFSVDVLSEPERISSLDQLDPKRWGVIVSRGMRRGVLLPDLDGVDSVNLQIDIASQKAGIRGTDGVSIDRFSVKRYKEED
ncbi:MAG: AmmeMemoRadiSam system protein A [Synergistaceae bacterium]|jgi:AmmeMemoRadiSam system protein A|nr:AmmeMemoRadiSam system protein A [Synergistaceae bacterium]